MRRNPADRFVVRPHAVADTGPRTRLPSSASTVLCVGRVSSEKGVAASAGLSDGLVNSMSASGSMPASRAIWPLVRRLGL